MARPILYSFRRCPYAMRARMGIAISGVKCELREVKLAAKPVEMLDVSPKGTVPLLVLPDATVIDESLDILRWALGRSDPEDWRTGDDMALIAANDGPFKIALDRYKYPHRHDSDPLEHRDAGLAILRDLDGRLAVQGQLCGPARTLADIAIFPFVRQFAEVDRAWFDAQALPALQRWLAGHLASSLFAEIMIRPAPWRAGHPPLLFPPERLDAVSCD